VNECLDESEKSFLTHQSISRGTPLPMRRGKGEPFAKNSSAQPTSWNKEPILRTSFPATLLVRQWISSTKGLVSIQTSHCHPTIHMRTPLLIRQGKFGQSSLSHLRKQVLHRTTLFNPIRRTLWAISEGVSEHPLLKY
jgi:hypothetical protein